MKWLAAPICLLFLTQVAFAQSPYGGMQMRPIKALSDHMGLALPAELNGYPGLIHVLELSDQLGLTADQKAKVSRAVSFPGIEPRRPQMPTASQGIVHLDHHLDPP
jgi:hypothetical protein